MVESVQRLTKNDICFKNFDSVCNMADKITFLFSKLGWLAAAKAASIPLVGDGFTRSFLMLSVKPEGC